MNSRERVRAALERRQPDRIPFDLGGTLVTGIGIGAYRGLRARLGLPERPIRVADIVQQLAVVDEDIAERLGTDVRVVVAAPPSGVDSELRDEPGFTWFTDEFGVGWRMPRDAGLYYDLFRSPLAGDISPDDIDRLPLADPVDPVRFTTWGEECRARAAEGRAVALDLGGGGIMETAAWMRGFEDFYVDLAAEPRLAERLLDRLLAFKVAAWERALDLAGDAADVVCEWDDLGAQGRTLIAPEMYRRIVKPRHRELLAAIHARTDARVLFHSCGAIRELIPDLIEIGVDALNPVQVNASGMDTLELKREFGGELAFWGGGVDTQRVLPFGTPGDVREEVRRRIEDLAPGGGFVFAAVHNIQANVPAENVVAMWETLREYGGYDADESPRASHGDDGRHTE
jgi:uroporphyrinogen decarboxylase